jgi:hypothetical protein
MTINNKIIRYNIKQMLFKVIPICVFFYITFTKYFPRGVYNIAESEMRDSISSSIDTKCESLSKHKVRKKILQDLKLHTKYTNWNRKNITKLILNKEGKIIGYKFYTVFYPNYFTKSQTDRLMTKNKFSKNKSCLQSIIIKYN